MTAQPHLASLLTRVEGLTGPDREVDALIWLRFTSGATRELKTVKSAKSLWPDYTIDETRDAFRTLVSPPPYTASLDAALALVERVRPDWYVRIQGCNSAWYAEINPTRAGSFHGSFEANGSTAPLALLAALLKSLAHAE